MYIGIIGAYMSCSVWNVGCLFIFCGSEAS